MSSVIIEGMWVLKVSERIVVKRGGVERLSVWGRMR